jgi:DNA-binding transcriptional regulator YdaS (Cro superfamily)
MVAAMSDTPKARAARAAIDQAGGLAALGRALGITPQAINNWKASGIPADRVLDVERITGISRHELRPDVFGSAEVAA